MPKPEIDDLKRARESIIYGGVSSEPRLKWQEVARLLCLDELSQDVSPDVALVPTSPDLSVLLYLYVFASLFVSFSVSCAIDYYTRPILISIYLHYKYAHTIYVLHTNGLALSGRFF